mgnify:FL=1
MQGGELNNLYIIGNGFDRAHGFPTSYTDFAYFIYKEYIADTQPEYKFLEREEFLEESENILRTLQDDIWDFPPSEVEGAQPRSYEEGLILGFLGILGYARTADLWSELETALGNIDYKSIRHAIDDVVDSDGDFDMGKTGFALEDGSQEWTNAACKFKSTFRDWINTVEIEKSKKIESFYNYLKEHRGYFLNFNYTETLQKLYCIQDRDVLHIHGFRGDGENSIIVGHNSGEIKYESSMLGYNDNIRSLHATLKKNPQLDSLKKFLNTCEDITNIICIGFSFGDSDDEYIRALINHPKTSHAAWVLNEYKKSEVDKQSRKLQGFGIDSSKITPEKIL